MELIPEATKSPTLWCVPIPSEVQSVSDGPFVRTNFCDDMRVSQQPLFGLGSALCSD
jgi:hypothetical protein